MTLCARRGLRDEDGAVLMVEHPQIPIVLANAQAGLVRLQDRSRQQPCADRLALLGEGVAADDKILTMAPSLMSKPRIVESSVDSRSSAMFCVKRI